MKVRSIQSSLFFTYSVIIIVVFIMLVTPFYLWGADQLTTRGSDYMENLAYSIQQKLDLEINGMDNYSMSVLYSNLVKDRFSRFITSADAGNGNVPSKNASADPNTEELREILIATIGPAWDIQQINLYDFDGQVLGAGFDSRVLDVSVQNMSWYAEVMALDGKKLITPPYTDKNFSTVTLKNPAQKYISVCRIFYDSYNRPQGIVEIRQTYEKLFKNLSSSNDSTAKNEKIYIYDHAGNQIYPSPSTTETPDTMPYFTSIKKLASSPSPLRIYNAGKGETELVQSNYSEYTGWYTVIVASERQLLAPLYSFTRLMLFFAVILLFLALFLSFYAAKNFTVPIAQLHKAIQSMNLLQKGPEQPKIRGKFNELVELNLAFQKMSSTAKKSLDDLLLSQKQEMQARMLALQSQMNPHFLYNTLATISVMSEENMNAQITELCGNVSDLLRYISSDKSPTVTMEMELEYTKKYLACMQMRYGGKLSYSIDLEPSMYDLEIPKLIIQPLVENALKYGIMTSPPWEIQISGTVVGNRWSLRVADNGSGFSPEVIRMLEEKMDEIRRTNLLPSLELDGMGLLNVYTRLWLSYRDNMIFLISGNQRDGAEVMIGGTL